MLPACHIRNRGEAYSSDEHDSRGLLSSSLLPGHVVPLEMHERLMSDLRTPLAETGVYVSVSARSNAAENRYVGASGRPPRTRTPSRRRRARADFFGLDRGDGGCGIGKGSGRYGTATRAPCLQHRRPQSAPLRCPPRRVLAAPHRHRPTHRLVAGLSSFEL